MDRPRIVDLSVPISDHTGEVSVSRAAITRMDAEATASELAEDFQISLDLLPSHFHLVRERLCLSVHTGTHMDAPSHYGPRNDGAPATTIDEIPLDWCYGSGVVLDFAGRPGDVISAVDVQEALQELKHDLQEGEIVLIRTGADRYFGDPRYANCHAGPGRDACEYLLDSGIRVIGTDACLLDPPVDAMVERLKAGDRDQFFASHYLGRRRPHVQIEKLANLDKIPSTGFLVAAFPVSIEGAGGAWVRAVAIV